MMDKNKECKIEVGGFKKYKDQIFKENGINKKEEKNERE